MLNRVLLVWNIGFIEFSMQSTCVLSAVLSILYEQMVWVNIWRFLSWPPDAPTPTMKILMLDYFKILDHDGLGTTAFASQHQKPVHNAPYARSMMKSMGWAGLGASWNLLQKNAKAPPCRSGHQRGTQKEDQKYVATSLKWIEKNISYLVDLSYNKGYPTPTGEKKWYNHNRACEYYVKRRGVIVKNFWQYLSQPRRRNLPGWRL